MKNCRRRQQGSRRGGGAIIVITSISLIALLGITGLVFDVGQIKVTRTQLQAGSDSAALSAGAELPYGLGAGATRTQVEVETAARAIAVQYAGLHRSGDLNSAYADAGRDIDFGKATYDTATGTWTLDWGSTPVNMVRANLLRNQAESTDGDGPLPLIFGSLFQKLTADVTAYATAAVLPGSRFEIPPGSGITCGILPFALDLETWEQEIEGGAGADSYRWDPDADPLVAGGGDGRTEADLYPHDSTTVPNAGNRGTVDIGHHGNSTSVITRQILDGPNEDDLAYHGGGLSASTENPLVLNGETGMSNGFKDELAAIIGHPRLIPIFSTINDRPGNNADFTIVRFEPIVILDVKLTGNPANRYVYIQKATISDPCVVVDLDEEITEETSIFTTPVLIE